MATPCPQPSRDLRARAERLGASEWSAASDPLEVLALCRPLREGIRDYERRLVEVARDRGASWATIASALGVTPQTAHRTYAYERKGDR